MEKQITTEVTWNTDFDAPCSIRLTFHENEIETIRHLREVAYQNDCTIVKDLGKAEYLDRNDEPHDFRQGYSSVKIYKDGGVIFEAQGKHNSECQLESDFFAHELFPEEYQS